MSINSKEKSDSVYIRVSTEDQVKEGYSPGVQRDYLEFFAEKEGLRIFKIYQDNGISGYTKDRPVLKELLEDMGILSHKQESINGRCPYLAVSRLPLPVTWDFQEGLNSFFGFMPTEFDFE